LLLQGVGGDELYHRGALLYWLAWVGRLAEALALAAPLVAHGPGTTARGLAGLGMVYFHLGRPEEAERTLADAQASFQAHGQQVEVYFRLADRLRVARVYHLDDPARWQHLPAELGDAVRRAAGTGRMERDEALLEVLIIRGEWAEAYHRAVATTFEGWVGATIARYRGEAAAAWASIDNYLPHGPSTAPGSHSLSHALLLQQLAANLALDAGDLPTTRAWLAAHDRWLDWSESIWGRAEGHLGWATYHRATGDHALAQQHAERTLAHATEPRQPLALLAAHRTLGELALAAGRFADATRHLDAALALADACGAPYERALTLLAQADMHRAEGQQRAAETALNEARATFVRLQARPALERCDALAAHLNVTSTSADIPSPSPSGRSPNGLTAREIVVLRLVVTGRSNREMAETLCRSERTIERHLENIYRKIAARNRADATAYALRHHLA
jgi:DNA-binding CsgD family transcriptional regulator/tetratricopeptide (TPR) repeat protein